jgi:hypothetical protein
LKNLSRSAILRNNSLKKEAGHATRHAVRRTPLPGSQIRSRHFRSVLPFGANDHIAAEGLQGLYEIGDDSINALDLESQEIRLMRMIFHLDM